MVDQGEPAIRVLLVDDSPAVQRLLARAFDPAEGFSVVGAVGDGSRAVAEVQRLRPDVVVLDLGLPGRSGTEVIAALHRLMPNQPIVIFSGQPRPTMAVYEALTGGTVEFVAKPTASVAGGPMAYLRSELLPVVRLLGGRTHLARSRPVPAQPVPPRRLTPTLITVACSTGGPEALAVLLGSLRPFPDVPVTVVQHMPEGFTAILAARLDSMTDATVCEAADGQVLAPRSVLIAPGGRHMSVVRRGTELVVALDDGPKVNFCRPAADVLFRSAAVAEGSGVLAVVLSGMGRDGSKGSIEILRTGGHVIAQSVESAAIASMPAAVAAIAAAVLPVEQIGNEIMRRCGWGAPR